MPSNIGPILISINPYKWTDIYNDAVVDRYTTDSTAADTASPHIFQVAARALSNLLASSGSRERKNQAVIISGESGSGKTEATKLILKYLTKRTARFEGGKSIELQVSLATPLLESFGNAKTLRNDNSSRFGKFLQVQFSREGKIVGAKVKNYLLEKTRIVRQAENERNYHIFYQVLSAAPLDVLKSVGLERDASYEFITHGRLPGADRAGFERMERCFKEIFVDDSEERMNCVMKTLAAVLHLGNLIFIDREESEGSTVEVDDTAGAWVCRLLEVDMAALSSGFCHSVMRVKDEELRIPLGADKAELKRDALAKVLYSLLFKWLVDSLNETMKARDVAVDGEIGILDIYGFERFDSNGFEQLCINFANEKLQKQYNEHVFEVEQAEYEREEIDWSYIQFQDNSPCLSLIDTGALSILNLLDEACLMPKGSDESLLQKLNAQHARDEKSPHFRKPRFSQPPAFILVHYAGAVKYTVTGFVQKNKESLSDSVCALIKCSRSKWFSTLISRVHKPQSQSQSKPQKRSRKSLRPPTISQQFRKQLNALVMCLNACDPHYIRCIKPNDFKRKEDFNIGKISHQLRCAGVFETLRIRAQGYAYRCPHQAFFNSNRCIIPKASNCKDLMRGIQNIIPEAMENSSWQMGKTKVFLKQRLAEALKTLAAIRRRRAATSIQKAFKVYMEKKKSQAASTLQSFFVYITFRKLRIATVVIQKWFTRRLTLLREKEAQLAAEKACDQSLSESVCEEPDEGDEDEHLCQRDQEVTASPNSKDELPAKVEGYLVDDTMEKTKEGAGEEEQDEDSERSEFEAWKRSALAREAALEEELRLARHKLAELATAANNRGDGDKAEGELEALTEEMNSLLHDAGIDERYEDAKRAIKVLRKEVILKGREMKANHEALLKDNITMVDELVDTRRKLHRMRLKLEEVTMNAKQAEFANETLVSIAVSGRLKR